MSNDDLPGERVRLARLQRARRARMVRVDYMPSWEAAAIIAPRWRDRS